MPSEEVMQAARERMQDRRPSILQQALQHLTEDPVNFETSIGQRAEDAGESSEEALGNLSPDAMSNGQNSPRTR